MTNHRTGTREEWLAARLELLDAEKEHTRRSDELARRRQELPWVRIEKEYRFETDEGSASLADLFRGRSQLLVYHFMFGPDYTAGCPSCSAIADGFDASVVHLANHGVTLGAVSRAPLAKLQAFKRRMGWSFPWASSFGSDFNYDFQAGVTEEQQQSGVVEYNFGARDVRRLLEAGKEGPLAEIAAGVGTDWPTFAREAPGLSAFAFEDGVVYHTYSAYARGLDGLWGMYQWLDRAPLGRNETGMWWRRHDEYTASEGAARLLRAPDCEMFSLVPAVKRNRSIPQSAVIPVLVYADVRAAVEWLGAAFGFVERVRIGENHRAQLRFGEGAVIVADVRGERRPPRQGEVTHSVVVRVDDATAHYERAKAQGARIVMEPTDFEYGERQYTAEDLAGHQWTFSETLTDVAPEEWGGMSIGSD